MRRHHCRYFIGIAETTRAISRSRFCSRYRACGCVSPFQVGEKPLCSLPWEFLWNIVRKGRRQHPEVRTPKDNLMLRIIRASLHVIRLLVVSSRELVTNSSRSSTYDCWLVGELRRAMVSMSARVRCFLSSSCMIWSWSSEDINSGRCGSSTWLPVIVTLVYPSDTGNKAKLPSKIDNECLQSKVSVRDNLKVEILTTESVSTL
jgi:hypothetical protein